MDTLTHIVLGACIGEAFLEKKIGKKAMIWGALAQSAPDIDFISHFWQDVTTNLLSHRGFTHSILFGILATVLLALIADRVHQPHDVRMRTWLLFFGLEIFGHIFLDSFNNYGVGLLEPFSHYRISFNTMYVADPFFSIWPAIAFVALLVLRRTSKLRKRWWQFGIGMSCLYLVYCVSNKIRMENDVQDQLQQAHISYTRHFTTPAPLQNWLWYVVAGSDSGYYVSYRSLFDSKPMHLQFFPRNDSMANYMKDDPAFQRLQRFSQRYYTIERWKDTLVFNDLRFGQVIGWQDPTEKFAFHYYLNFPGENALVVQRGRFAKWNSRSTSAFLRRIRGN